MSPAPPIEIPCGPAAFAVSSTRSFALSYVAVTPADEALIWLRMSLRLLPELLTVKTTPLIEKFPEVTAVAKPALFGALNVAPRLMPPMFAVLVAL